MTKSNLLSCGNCRKTTTKDSEEVDEWILIIISSVKTKIISDQVYLCNLCKTLTLDITTHWTQ